MVHSMEPQISPGYRIIRNIPVLIVSVLLLILYIPVIIPLVRQWLNDPNYRHGLLVPVISAILIYRNRKREESKETSTSNSGIGIGLVLILLASTLLIVGTAARELFTSRISIPVMLSGLSLFFYGKKFTLKLIYPLLLLFLMVPLPYIIYYKLTFPLQILSAKLSTNLISMIGISVIRRGNILILPNYTLEVVAACSGLRSLMSMVTLAFIMIAFIDLPATRKVLLVLCAIPAAILANMIRLAVTAIGATLIGPEFAEGTIHNISGLIVFGFGIAFLVISAIALKWKRQ